MGSKRKLSSDILRFIMLRHGKITDFYDLFGGGGSVSFTAIKDYRFNVHYNELNSHIFELVKYLKSNKTLDSKFYQWVNRDQFFDQISKVDADWYSGFVMSCWSFGNSQTCYLYGKDIEEKKRLAHEFVVHGDLSAMMGLGLDIPELMNIKGLHERRVLFCRHIEKVTKTHYQLQSLERLERLETSNLSYENVIIKGNNPVIYCDIPYKGTGEYKEGNFNHDLFYKWAAEINYAVYISEYNTPFQEVHAFTHRSSLSATNNAKKTVEKIFWNGKGNINQTKLF